MSERTLEQRVLLLECVVEKLMDQLGSMQQTLSQLKNRDGSTPLNSSTLSKNREKLEQEKNKQYIKNKEKELQAKSHESTISKKKVLKNSPRSNTDTISKPLSSKKQSKAIPLTTTNITPKKPEPLKSSKLRKKQESDYSDDDLFADDEVDIKPAPKLVQIKRSEPVKQFNIQKVHESDYSDDDLFADNDEPPKPQQTRNRSSKMQTNSVDDLDDDDIQF